MHQRLGLPTAPRQPSLLDPVRSGSHRRERCRAVTDRGQILPMVAVQLTLVAIVVLVIGALGTRAVHHARASSAADAAALAAATTGSVSDGLAIGAANGATATVSISRRNIATAQVTSGSVTASATARQVRSRGTNGLSAAMVAAIARASDLLGVPIPVVSGWRSAADQLALWEAQADNPFPVAAPGTSMHELGLAIDVPADFVPNLLTVAGQVGLCQPLPVTDPIHFELCAARPS